MFNTSGVTWTTLVNKVVNKKSVQNQDQFLLTSGLYVGFLKFHEIK